MTRRNIVRHSVTVTTVTQRGIAGCIVSNATPSHCRSRLPTWGKSCKPVTVHNFFTYSDYLILANYIKISLYT